MFVFRLKRKVVNTSQLDLKITILVSSLEANQVHSVGSVAEKAKTSFLTHYLDSINTHPGKIVVSLVKTLYNNYLCWVASKKQQIQWTKI